MSLSAKNYNKKTTERTSPDAGTHMARVVGLVDLGHQPAWEYKGEMVADSFKITFKYELVNSLMEDGRPHWVSEDVNVNDFEGDGISSRMMQRVRSIDPENDTRDGQDLSKLVGKPCMVTVALNDKGYAKIKGVAGVPMGMDVPDLKNNPQIFDMSNPDMDVWEALSDFEKGKIKDALNYTASPLAKALAEQDDY